MPFIIRSISVEAPPVVGTIITRQITIEATPIIGTVITRPVTILPPSDSIVSVSGSTAGSVITVTTGGAQNLYTGAPSLTYAGIALTSLTVTSASTLTALMPATGIELGSENDFVLTVGGSPSPGFPATFDPALGQFATFSVPFASFSPDSWARDDELVGVTESIIAGMQIEITEKTNGTTSTPAGYDVNVDGLGNIWLSDPAGSEGNLEAEDEEVTVDIALIDSTDGYARSNVMSVIIAINMPSGTLTLGAPGTTSTAAALPFGWTGTNADAFEYQIGSGSITEIALSPIGLSGLTASTTYSYRVRPKNGSWPGQWVSGTFTTQSASGTSPDPLVFASQGGVQISTAVVSNSVRITGVAAGQDIAASIAGGEYSVSTDNELTWGAWTSASSNVRLNYMVRLRVTSPATYDTALTAIFTAGTTSGEFSVTTRSDDVGPVVTIPGPNPLTWPLGTPFVAPTATATDNVDGAVPVTISGTVNHNSAGQYPVTFRAYDLVGNEGSAVLLVNVVASAGDIEDFVPSLLVAAPDTVRVFIDRDNTTRFSLTHDGVAVNLAQFTRFVISGFPEGIDSDERPDIFDAQEGDGVLDVLLGAVVNIDGVYRVRLVAYGAGHPNGVVLIDPSLVNAHVTAIVMHA